MLNKNVSVRKYVSVRTSGVMRDKYHEVPGVTLLLRWQENMSSLTPEFSTFIVFIKHAMVNNYL